MSRDEINIVSNALIAFSTIVGVAGALGYYSSQIQNFGMAGIISLEIAYFLSVMLVILWLRRKLQ